MRNGGRTTDQVAIVIAVGIGAGVTPAPAEQAVRLWGGGSASAVEVVSESPTAVTGFRGIVLGAEAQIAVGPVGLHVGYVEGELDPTGGAGAGHRHVEGIALLGATLLPGLEVRGGPRLRAIVRDQSTQRSLVWQVGGRYEAAILEPWIRGVARVWIAVGGDVSIDQEFSNARGGAAGILLRPRGGPLEIRLDYSIDQLRFENDGGAETLEALILTVGWGRR